jgi:hypothetical protein
MLGSAGIVDRFAAEVTVSSLIQGIPNHLSAHPASYLIGDVGCCPKVKAALAWSWPPPHVVLRLGMSGAARALSQVYPSNHAQWQLYFISSSCVEVWHISVSNIWDFFAWYRRNALSFLCSVYILIFRAHTTVSVDLCRFQIVPFGKPY